MSGTSEEPDQFDSAHPAGETKRDSDRLAPENNGESMSEVPNPEIIDEESSMPSLDMTSEAAPSHGNDVSEIGATAELSEDIEIPPTNIGRYDVISKLGAGGFGSVYLAHDPMLNRKVAIKLPLFESNLGRRNSFIEEGRSVARLNHPSIVRVYNIEETEDGDPFVVMEYVEGPTLKEVIEKKGLTFSTSLKYLIQLAEALVYAHGETLIHRDIKPANVVVSKVEDLAKLMDFGMASSWIVSPG